MFRRLSFALLLVGAIVISGCVGGGGGSKGDIATIRTYLERLQNEEDIEAALKYFTDPFEIELLSFVNGVPACETLFAFDKYSDEYYDDYYGDENEDEPCIDKIREEFTHKELMEFADKFGSYVTIEHELKLGETDYTIQPANIRVRGNTAETSQDFLVRDVLIGSPDDSLYVDVAGTYETYWRRVSNDWKIYKLRMKMDFKYQE